MTSGVGAGSTALGGLGGLEGCAGRRIGLKTAAAAAAGVLVTPAVAAVGFTACFRNAAICIAFRTQATRLGVRGRVRVGLGWGMLKSGHSNQSTPQQPEARPTRLFKLQRHVDIPEHVPGILRGPCVGGFAPRPAAAGTAHLFLVAQSPACGPLAPLHRVQQVLNALNAVQPQPEAQARPRSIAISIDLAFLGRVLLCPRACRPSGRSRPALRSRRGKMYPRRYT